MAYPVMFWDRENSQRSKKAIPEDSPTVGSLTGVIERARLLIDN